MAAPIIESSLQSYRIEFVRETTFGTPPANPTWILYSDIVTAVNWSPDATMTALRGVGDVDPADHVTGAETHPLTISYYLQNTISSTNDASYDGLSRNSDGRFNASHTVVVRRTENTGGNDSNGYRVYTVATGAHVGQVVLNGEPGTGEPIRVDLTYQAEKIRSYEIHQPAANSTLSAVSTSTADSMSFTIESDSATKSESITLNGTTAVATTATFTTLDAAWFAGNKPAGTVSIKNGANTLMTIYGSGSYQSIEGDEGVPLLTSTGSHASAFSRSYETIWGDTVQRPAGTDLAYDINSMSLSVNNNLTVTPRIASLKQRIHPGIRDVQLTATIIGEDESHDKIIEHLQITTQNIVWTMTNNTLSLTNAVLMTPGARSLSTGEAVMTLDNTFEAEGLTVDGVAV